MLRGRRGLVVGIANEHSIAFGCAATLRAASSPRSLPTMASARSSPAVMPAEVHSGPSTM